MQLLDGRYGPYVSDGTTNASLPKDAKPEELTMEIALQLLADRAAKGTSKSAPRKSAPRKKPAAAAKKAGGGRASTRKSSGSGKKAAPRKTAKSVP